VKAPPTLISVPFSPSCVIVAKTFVTLTAVLSSSSVSLTGSLSLPATLEILTSLETLNVFSSLFASVFPLVLPNPPPVRMVIDPSSILTMVPRVSSATTRLPIASTKTSPTRLRLSMRASPCVEPWNDVPHQYKPQPAQEVSHSRQQTRSTSAVLASASITSYADEPSANRVCPDDGRQPHRGHQP